MRMCQPYRCNRGWWTRKGLNMGKAFALLVLGAIILAAGVWYTMAVGDSIAAIIAALIMATGGAIIVWGIAVALDVHSPTSRKL